MNENKNIKRKLGVIRAQNIKMNCFRLSGI